MKSITKESLGRDDHHLTAGFKRPIQCIAICKHRTGLGPAGIARHFVPVAEIFAIQGLRAERSAATWHKNGTAGPHWSGVTRTGDQRLQHPQSYKKQGACHGEKQQEGSWEPRPLDTFPIHPAPSR